MANGPARLYLRPEHTEDADVVIADIHTSAAQLRCLGTGGADRRGVRSWAYVACPSGELSPARKNLSKPLITLG